MKMRERFWQNAVTPKGEKVTGRPEDIAADKTEGGNGRAGEEKGAAAIAEETTSRFGERSRGIIAELARQDALRDNLDGDVDECRDDQRHKDRAGHGSARVFHFAAWNKRDFNSDESEHEQQDGATESAAAGPSRPGQR